MQGEDGLLSCEKSTVGRLDIVLLRALVAVAEGPTLTVGAKKLNIPQPTMSLQLKKLEERSGRQLFERPGRGHTPRLTRHGERLLGYARQILSKYDEAVLYLSAPDLAGNIRIGMPEWFAESGLSKILFLFKEQYENVQIKLVASPSNILREQVRTGELDVAIAIVGDDVEPYGAIWREALHWVGGNDLRCLSRKYLPVGLFSPPCPFRDHVIRQLDGAGTKWREEYMSDSVATIRTAVAAGLAVSVLPAGAITPKIQVIDHLPGFSTLPPVELAIHLAEKHYKSGPTPPLINKICEFIATRMDEYKI